MRIDFSTNNPRWGISGISFATLEEYVYVLGFLTNARHYQNYDGSPFSNYDKSIEIQIEGNYVDGAWAKECRIHYLKDELSLRNLSQSLSDASSAGRPTHGIIARINSNEFINHLISDYNFGVLQTGGYSDFVIPPSKELVHEILENLLLNEGRNAGKFIMLFNEGFDL
ncbi:hypothetical protein K1I94_10795 [Streptococcus sanguinis]|uniref:hypothetical protein n=1 Tax=Streptococcus sanguinis TaxID=1305 RepID=UPI001CBC1CD0|nr:hypothetical protein [Streptococcus sanguinis]MBZ2067371.1 hypothetical protein [Streptococcus sanguinis]